MTSMMVGRFCLKEDATASARSPGFSTLKPPGAEQLGELIEARIAELDAEVVAAERFALVGFFGAPGEIVENQDDRIEPHPNRGLDLLHVHRKAAVTIDGQDRRFRSCAFEPERGRKAEAERGVVERREQGRAFIVVESIGRHGAPMAGISTSPACCGGRPGATR